jgi:hypothetical protein
LINTERWSIIKESDLIKAIQKVKFVASRQMWLNSNQ